VNLAAIVVCGTNVEGPTRDLVAVSHRVWCEHVAAAVDGCGVALSLTPRGSSVGAWNEGRIRRAVSDAERVLPGWLGRPSLREKLTELIETTREDERSDLYGSGERIERFEQVIAELLGTEAAVFMPNPVAGIGNRPHAWWRRRGDAVVRGDRCAWRL